jgi:hypothetical protein
MDERPPYDLKAPGGRDPDGAPMRLPGRTPFPHVDDHLVQPEVTRDEMIGGRLVVAMPAKEPHADLQSDLDYVLRAHAAPGYRSSSDLITRHDVDSDFASDACLRKEGIDPETGRRYLEEIAFEVVSEQNQQIAKEKALRMHRRGVRRIFAIFVKRRRVCEWSAERGGWSTLEPGSRIEDPCLTIPLEVAALLDAATADNAVVEALAAKGNPALRRREAAASRAGEAAGVAKGRAEGEAKGEAKGKAEAILAVLETRGIAVSEGQRREILRCADLARLDRWLRRAALAAATAEVIAEP